MSQICFQERALHSNLPKLAHLHLVQYITLRCCLLLFNSLTRNPIIMGSLLLLPPELRNEVYELCLISNMPLDIQCLDASTPHEHGLTPSLLHTCRQIYQEANGILYGLNIFRVRVRMALHHALRRYEVKAAMRYLNLAPDVEPREPRVEEETLYLQHPCLNRIKRLEVSLEQDVLPGPHQFFGDHVLDHTIWNVCHAILDTGQLELLTIHSQGYTRKQQLLPAASNRDRFAQQIEYLLQSYHEWQCERLYLSARCGVRFLYLHGDDIGLDQEPLLWGELRAFTTPSEADRCKLTRTLPTWLARTANA